MRRLTICMLASAGLAAAAVQAAPGTAPPPLPPTYSWAYQPVGVDEKGLWMEADELERQVRDSRLVLHDEALTNYVRGVLCRAVGEDRCAGVRLYIMRDPSFNASMAPNGMLMINTGTLLRVRGEAELAAVLAHEFGHFELRHQLAAFKRARGASDAMMWIGIAVGSNGGLLQLAIAGSFYSFQRQEETAADMRSFDYLAKSPYRAGAFAEIWDRMLKERDATAAARNQTSHGGHHTSFFDTHPCDAERLAYLKEAAAKRGNSGDDGVEAYAQALASWRPQFLADQLKLNDFGGSEFILNTLASAGWTKELLAARGDLYRLRGNPRDLVVAAQSYRDAIAQGSTDPVVRRDLGMVLLRNGSRADAATALQQYLALRPDATDKTMVAMLIDQAGTAGQGGAMSAQATVPPAAATGQEAAPAASGALANGAMARAGAQTLAPVNDRPKGDDTK